MSHHLLRTLLVMAIFVAPASAMAVINAEDSVLSSDKEGLGGNIGLSVNGNSGNSEKVNADINGKLIWRHGAHTELLLGGFNYGQSRGTRNSNKSFIHLRHRYALDPSWDLEAFGQAQQNEFSSLKLRTLFGGGVRWSLYEEKVWVLHIGLGSFYEREQLSTGHVPKTTLWRINSYAALNYAIKDGIYFHNTIYYQPAWKDRADFRLHDDAALNISITDRIDLKLSLQLEHDSQPPAGVKGTDIYYKTGLEVHF